jgi:hypothetical protein
VHADQTKPFTAVRPFSFASAALSATDIWFNGATVSDPKPSWILPDLGNFACKLMTQNTRIRVDGMSSRNSVKIASANPYPMNANQGFSTRGHRTRDLEVEKFARSLQQNHPHNRILRTAIQQRAALPIGPAIM